MKGEPKIGDDATCGSIVSLLLPTSYRVWIAVVELPQSRCNMVRMQCQSKKSSRVVIWLCPNHFTAFGNVAPLDANLYLAAFAGRLTRSQAYL